MTKVAKTDEPLEGSTLEGLYRVGPILREGGMGTVHQAVQMRLNKPVAIKVMARDLVGDADALVRFRREAEITSAIGHPHIVQIFDVGTTPAGEPFLVMELLEGEDLEHRLERVGRLSAPDMLHVVRQVASALAAVHAKGIVHRDLKPANIFLVEAAGETDFVKVLDFGVSKMTATRTGPGDGAKVVGTPRYMSREQAQGLVAQIDERTDEWALACIAWEAVSGRPPFLAEDNLALLYQVVHETPAPLVTDASAESFALEQVLRRALAKDKSERFAHVTEFAAALEEVVERRAPRTTAVSCRHARPTLRLASTVRHEGWRQPRGRHTPRPSAAVEEQATLPDRRLHRAGPLPRKESPRMKWLWPAAAIGLIIALFGLPVREPRPAEPTATARAAAAAVPNEARAPSSAPATVGEPPATEGDRPASATAEAVEPAPPATRSERPRARARSSGRLPATAVREAHAPVSVPARPRPPLEQRLLREL